MRLALPLDPNPMYLTPCSSRYISGLNDQHLRHGCATPKQESKSPRPARAKGCLQKAKSTGRRHPQQGQRGRPKKVQHALVFNLKMHKAFPNYEVLNGLYFFFHVSPFIRETPGEQQRLHKKRGVIFNVVIFVSRKYQ